MKATPRLSNQIYCVEMRGTDREREMEGGSDRSGSQGHESEEKQKRGREWSREEEERLFSQRTQIDLWLCSG